MTICTEVHMKLKLCICIYGMDSMSPLPCSTMLSNHIIPSWRNCWSKLYYFSANSYRTFVASNGNRRNNQRINFFITDFVPLAWKIEQTPCCIVYTVLCVYCTYIYILYSMLTVWPWYAHLMKRNAVKHSRCQSVRSFYFILDFGLGWHMLFTF